MFDPAKQLRKATSRAKSDVANKLVSMMLHEVSRKAATALGGSVYDADYAAAVLHAFGPHCAYCGKTLENDRAVVEHLEGMNRIRLGLHLPGNVALACVQCNREKRRDDQSENSPLADTGWQAFLAHNGQHCPPECLTCGYWSRVWPDPKAQQQNLCAAQDRLQAFRAPFARFIDWNAKARPLLRAEVEQMYRDCQAFARAEIDRLISKLPLEL